MSVKIFGKGKKAALKRRHARIRKRISGTAERPRLVVTRSNRHMVAQIVDDNAGKTLVSESTLMADFADFQGTKTEAAKKVGELLAKKAKDAGITTVVFDRGGNVVIPSFAVADDPGTALLHPRDKGKESGQPATAVSRWYIDSPLAIEATRIFKDTVLLLL